MKPRSTRARFVAAVAAGLWNVAWAGLPVSLPPGESAADWRAPLEVANLELAVHDSDVVVQIEAVGGDWVLRAVGTDRQVVVPAPTDEATRTEVAVLARALGRSIDPLATPDGALTPPPPPPPALEPPAPRARPRPEPAPEPEPEPVSDASVVAPLAAEIVAVAATHGIGEEVARWLPAPPAAFVAPPVTTTPLAPPPPVGLALGGAFRADANPAFTVTLRVDPLRLGNLSLGVEAGVRPYRNTWVDTSNSVPWRGFWDASASAVGRSWLLDFFYADAIVGLAWRGFQQQGIAVATRFIPQVGLGAGITYGRGVRTGIQARVTYELVTVEFVDAFGGGANLPVAEVGVAWVVELGAQGDPIELLRTPRPR